MKCRTCGHKAAVHMRQHRLALCKEHFLDWIPQQTQRFIKKYRMFSRRERILVAVSGGKDSLSLWDILCRLGYACDGLYIGLGIDHGIGYSDKSQQLTEEFAQSRGLELLVVDIQQQYGESIPMLAGRTLRGKEKPCAICGMTKRHVMNRVAYEKNYDVLVTGHNLDDEASVLFANTLQWASSFLVRQWPVLEATRPGLTRKAKPLCRFYERDMAAYAFLRGIDYIYEECPFAEGSKSLYYKELLNRLEEDRAGAKLAFYLSFLQAKQEGLFASNGDKGEEQLHNCPSCGQPTSTPQKCTFCRMVEKGL
jgi:tRNA-5-methyluridine54 2-sulfurtransferase